MRLFYSMVQQPNPREVALLWFERDHREVLALQLAAPPCAARAAFGKVGEFVIVDLRANIPWRSGWKRIPRHERQHVRRAFKQPQHEIDEPAVTLIIAEGRSEERRVGKESRYRR